ncbi:MAG: formylglycine-generating enzyme family protein [Cyanobacteria bacterium J06626_18]
MELSSNQPLDTTAPALIRRVSRTGKGYQEPLLTITDALPLHMVLIPQGSFTMGSPDDEPERRDTEGPQHEVTVPAFFLGRYPVTQAQYETVMETNPATDYKADRFVAPDKPVVGVSWQKAVAFCDRLAELTGRPYRLPSEAEWEYACRAGTTTPFYFGKTLTDELANYDASKPYAGGPEGEYRNKPTPVNYFGLANAFGLSDMHGNVLEWCQDHWHSNYEGAPKDGSAWLSSDENESRIFRGGSWGNYPWNCRSASRGTYRPVNRDNFIGFRVCCSAPRALQ